MSSASFISSCESLGSTWFTCLTSAFEDSYSNSPAMVDSILHGILNPDIDATDNPLHYINILTPLMKQYHKDMARSYVLSLGDNFTSTSFNAAIDITIQLANVQDIAIKFNTERALLKSKLKDKILLMALPITRELQLLLLYELDSIAYNNILKTYEQLKGIGADDVFHEPSLEEFNKFRLSKDYFLSSNNNYFLCGYVIYRRLLKAMKDKSKRIPVKYHALINSFLEYCFYSKENKDEANEELGDSTILIKTLEKFNGYAYTKPMLFYFYEYMIFTFYINITQSNAIIFHRLHPHKIIEEMLLNSIVGRKLFDPIFELSIANMVLDMKEMLQGEKTVIECKEVIWNIIVQGVNRVPLKSTFNNILQNFIKRNSLFKGIRVSMDITTLSSNNNKPKSRMSISSVTDINDISREEDTDIDNINIEEEYQLKLEAILKFNNVNDNSTDDKDDDDKYDDDDDDDDDEISEIIENIINKKTLSLEMYDNDTNSGSSISNSTKLTLDTSEILSKNSDNLSSNSSSSNRTKILNNF